MIAIARRKYPAGLLQKKNPLRWGERRYYALDYYLKQNFGEKLYKISLNGGRSCPNRDGTCGTRGCIFCSEGGSGDFAASSSLSVADQLAYGKDLIRPKYNGHSYIAYFQAYTNTYAPACHLRRIFTEAISDPEVRILSIATRPDCLSPEILTLLAELNAIKPVWVELGLQTIHERTANWMRRGYPLSVFEQAVHSLHAIGVQIITHVILFLPGESEADMLATIHYLNTLPIDGIKTAASPRSEAYRSGRFLQAGTFLYSRYELLFSSARKMYRFAPSGYCHSPSDR